MVLIFSFAAHEEIRLTQFVIFVVKIYMKQWYTCYNAVESPVNDLKFMIALKNYRQCNDEIARSCEEVLSRHLWYLGERMVGLAFFDQRLNINDLTRMTNNLQRASNAQNKIRNTTNIINVNLNVHISDFVTKETLEFFRIVSNKTEVNFYKKNPCQWEQDDEFKQIRDIVLSLNVTNDPAERGVAMIKEFNESSTTNEAQKQYLLQVVEQHRKDFPTASTSVTKEQLKKK